MFGFFKKNKNKKKETLKTEVKQTTESVVVEDTTQELVVKKERKLSYHITKHPSGGWQLKKGKAERALKRFKTQKEAIEYAKELEKKGASYMIHKQDGTTRKKKY